MYICYVIPQIHSYYLSNVDSLYMVILPEEIVEYIISFRPFCIHCKQLIYHDLYLDECWACKQIRIAKYGFRISKGYIRRHFEQLNKWKTYQKKLKNTY